MKLASLKMIWPNLWKDLSDKFFCIIRVHIKIQVFNRLFIQEFPRHDDFKLLKLTKHPLHSLLISDLISKKVLDISRAITEWYVFIRVLVSKGNVFLSKLHGFLTRKQSYYFSFPAHIIYICFTIFPIYIAGWLNLFWICSSSLKKWVILLKLRKHI